MDAFIAIYTHECKTYCDYKFFNHLFNTYDLDKTLIHIVDNTEDGGVYADRLRKIVGTRAEVSRISVTKEEKTLLSWLAEAYKFNDDLKKHALFKLNLVKSLNKLRGQFLKTDCPFFITLESDIIPPLNWLQKIITAVTTTDYTIIGGIYFEGIHPIHIKEEKFIHYEPPHIRGRLEHVFSGCTLYKRELLEQCDFKWNPKYRAYSDYYICEDAWKLGFKIADYTGIICEHLNHKSEYQTNIPMIRDIRKNLI